jgi:hypothetical protein
MKNLVALVKEIIAVCFDSYALLEQRVFFNANEGGIYSNQSARKG